MKAIGVVVEYNPFHNGHLYHLRESVKKSNADIVIAVMSGYFLQRGEPALVPKWERTKMALQGGVDLVVELPYAFATQKAETFANGAVSILDALHCSYLCFGSETGDIAPFLHTNEFLQKESEQYEEYIKHFMQTGVNYPTALSLAYQKISNRKDTLDLSQPNNILGFHYVKAISKLNSNMIPLTIKRYKAGYHDKDFASTSIASATSIRNSLFDQNADISSYVPNDTYTILEKYKEQYGVFHQWENYFSFLKYSLLTMKEEELKSIYEVEEGLENRVLKLIIDSHCFQDFMEQLKTKRYTWTRLQRLCMHILTRTSKQEMNLINQHETSPYIRLLGMSERGQEYLRSIKKNLKLPIISKVSGFHHPLFEIDLRAAATYFMIFPEPLRSRLLKTEYTTPPIRMSY
ncbi:nucleotidyltransferase [Virgibacillus sp. 6R]|uniref:nucleotidyltransferase n=1 Tax=Metabacillus sp. 22489 TaxID=3453928 RepID=UPI0011A33E98